MLSTQIQKCSKNEQKCITFHSKMKLIDNADWFFLSGPEEEMQEE